MWHHTHASYTHTKHTHTVSRCSTVHSRRRTDLKHLDLEIYQFFWWILWLTGTLFTHLKIRLWLWRLSWKRVWNVRGLPWKRVGNFGSRNYLESDLLRAWCPVSMTTVYQCDNTHTHHAHTLLHTHKHAPHTHTVTITNQLTLLSITVHQCDNTHTHYARPLLHTNTLPIHTHTPHTHTCTHTQNCLCSQDPQPVYEFTFVSYSGKKYNPQPTSWITIVLTIPWKWVYLHYWYRYVSLPCRDGKWVQKGTLWESLESRRNQIDNWKLT